MKRILAIAAAHGQLRLAAAEASVKQPARGMGVGEVGRKAGPMPSRMRRSIRLHARHH